MMRRTHAIALASLLAFIGCKSETKSEAKPQPVATGAGPQINAPARTADARPLPAAEDILAKHVKAAGGQAVVDGFKSIYSEGTLRVESQNLRGKVKGWWQQGRFYFEESIEGVGTTRAGYDGKRYWSDDPILQLRELTGREAEQYAWASCAFLPAKWRDYFSQAKTVGERDTKAGRVYDVQLQTKGGEKVQLSFDQKSGLMVEQKFEQHSAIASVPLTVRLSDYRVVGGYKLPHHQETETPLLRGVQTIEKMQVNRPVDASRFAFPVDKEWVAADPKLQEPPRALVKDKGKARGKKSGKKK